MPRKNKKFIIAIDGPAGSGKSTTARELAKRMKLPFIDTGAMYRAVTLKAFRAGIDFENTPHLVRIARGARVELRGKDPFNQRVFLDGKEVTKAIREPELTSKVVYAAREPRVRRILVKLQRAMGKKGGAVMEGRDIGSVVFPNADYKFYFDSDPRVRALRRWRELKAEGKKVPLNRVLKEILHRDKTDRNRKEGALRVAKGAIRLDTTKLTIDQTADKMLAIIGSAGSSLPAGRQAR